MLNMTCASCASSVQSMLNVQKGVVNAAVNFAAANVSVEYIPGDVNMDELRKAVQSIGFDRLIEEKANNTEKLEALNAKRYSNLKRHTIWAIVLSLPVVAIGMFFMNIPFANEIMWVLSTPVVLWLGRGFFSNALKQAKEAHMQASMIFTSNDIIINVGVITAAVLVNWLKTGYPDLIIGAIVFVLVAMGAYRILQLSK